MRRLRRSARRSLTAARTQLGCSWNEKSAPKPPPITARRILRLELTGAGRPTPAVAAISFCPSSRPPAPNRRSLLRFIGSSWLKDHFRGHLHNARRTRSGDDAEGRTVEGGSRRGQIGMI